MPTPPDKSLFDETSVIGWLVSVVFGLAAYAWNKLDRALDKLTDSQEKHAEADEEIHKDIYDKLREDEEKLNKLLGEHNQRRVAKGDDHEKDAK